MLTRTIPDTISDTARSVNTKIALPCRYIRHNTRYNIGHNTGAHIVQRLWIRGHAGKVRLNLDHSRLNLDHSHLSLRIDRQYWYLNDQIFNFYPQCGEEHTHWSSDSVALFCSALASAIAPAASTSAPVKLWQRKTHIHTHTHTLLAIHCTKHFTKPLHQSHNFPVAWM